MDRDPLFGLLLPTLEKLLKIIQETIFSIFKDTEIVLERYDSVRNLMLIGGHY